VNHYPAVWQAVSLPLQVVQKYEKKGKIAYVFFTF